MKKIIATLIAVVMTSPACAFFGFFEDVCCEVPCFTEYQRAAPPKPLPICSFYLFGDFLYWYVNEEGLSFGPAVFVDEPLCYDITTKVHHETNKGLKYEWDPGVRVGFGKHHAWNSWDFEAYWTYITSHASRTIDRSNHAHWHLQYNTVDAYFFQNFHARCFSFTPFAGIRAAFIQQKFRTQIHDKLITEGETFLSCVRQKNRQFFNGVGPQIGIETNFNFCNCFNVYGEVSGAAIFGRYSVKCHERDTVDRVPSCRDCHRNPNNCLFAFDAAAGLDWKPCLCYNIDLLLSIGYEYHRYFDTNFIGCKGDLYLQGLTLGANVNF